MWWAVHSILFLKQAKALRRGGIWGTGIDHRQDHIDRDDYYVRRARAYEKVADEMKFYSRNVPVTITAIGFDSLAQGVWSESVLSAYVYVLTGSSNTAVGLVDAAYGITQLIAALPTGYLADRYRKDAVVKEPHAHMRHASIFCRCKHSTCADILRTLTHVTCLHQQAGSFIILLAVALTLLAVLMPMEFSAAPEWVSLWLLVFACAFWGVAEGIAEGPLLVRSP